MTEITASAKLQAWLDGRGELSKADVRTVLWDLAEAQSALADAYEIIGTNAEGTPHIIEVTAGLDPFSPDAVHHTVHHPVQCHRLPYGEYCDFDSAMQRYRLMGPQKPGRYEARVEEWDDPVGAELLLERLDAEAGA